jgi:hypothetical protein
MGGWFDEKRFDIKNFKIRVCVSFSGEQIITLEDMIMVVEGYRLLRRQDMPNKFPGLSAVEGICYSIFIFIYIYILLRETYNPE